MAVMKISASFPPWDGLPCTSLIIVPISAIVMCSFTTCINYRPMHVFNLGLLMYVGLCMYACMYVCMHIYIMYVYMYVRMYVCMYVSMYVCMYVGLCTYVCTYVGLCMYVRMYV